MMAICILKKIYHPTIFLLLPFYFLILFRPQYNFWSTRTKETANFYYHYGVNKNVQFSLLYYYFTAAISKHFCREGAKYLTKKEKKVRRNYRNWKIFWEGLHSATAVVTWTMGKNLKKVRSQKGQEVHIFATYHSTFLVSFFHFLPAFICKRWNGKLWTKTYNPLQLHSYYISKMCTPCSIRNALYNSILYIVIFETFILYYSLKNIMIFQIEMTTISGGLLIVHPFTVQFLKKYYWSL